MHPERQTADRSSLGRAGLLRGVLVSATAVAIGAFVLTQGLDTVARPVAATDEAAAPDATLGTEATDGAGVGADAGDGSAEGTDPTVPETEADPGGDGTGSMSGADTTDPDADPGDASSTTEASEAPSPTVPDRSEVTILVLNGAGGSGVAARGSAVLQDAGFSVLAPKNADFLGPSLVLYTEGFELEAADVAAAYDVGDPVAVVQPYDPTASPIADIQDADIVVVVGQDGVISV